jgi:hypothetical protein
VKVGQTARRSRLVSQRPGRVFMHVVLEGTALVWTEAL